MNPSENAAPLHGRMVLTQQVLDAIRQTIGARPAECGGVLGADETGTITRYYFDETGSQSLTRTALMASTSGS